MALAHQEDKATPGGDQSAWWDSILSYGGQRAGRLFHAAVA